MTDTSLTIQEPPTALTITAPTADGLKALKKYARSGSAFYGQLLKCSGKDEPSRRANKVSRSPPAPN